jgi:DNA-binding NarL/FixJ family response regulator
LVKAGAKINARNQDGQTALMFLAARDEVDAIRDALKAGADASLKDSKGRTALNYLKLASCGKSPLYDPVTDGIYGYSKCTAFHVDDLRKAEKLLKDAVMGKK